MAEGFPGTQSETYLRGRPRPLSERCGGEAHPSVAGPYTYQFIVGFFEMA